MSDYEFEVSGLRKSYAGQPALNDITLSIKRGSMNFLLGSNGSGKSTLLSCLAGHQYWDKGEILRRGLDRKFDRKDFNAGLHLISEDINPPMASLADLRDVYRAIYPSWDQDVYLRFLSIARLDPSQNLTKVSRGQKVQGLMALTLAVKPEVLLIDEATAVFDPFLRHRLVSELEAINRSRGMTVVIATNIATELKGVHGRLMIMQQGKIVLDREGDGIAAGLVKIRVASADGSFAIDAGFSLLERNEDGSLSFVGAQSALARIESPHEVDHRTLSIDQVFIHFSDRKVA